MKIAALYARVSGEQQRDSNTIASQTEALVAYAERHGYRVAPDMIIEDDGYTGAVLERPGLERVRDLAAEGRIEAVLVHAPDRLSRRYAYQVLIIEELARQGVETVFLNAPSMKTPEDHLLVQFQGMIAEYERAQILERSRRGKRHRARRGDIAVLSGAPYGYRYHKKTPDSDAFYEIAEPQASVVRDVYRYYTCDHMSIGAIARKLNERAVPTSSGRSRWERSVVWAMLRNPAYKGRACFGKTRTAPRQRVRPLRQRDGFAGRNSVGHERPREDWIEIAVPAIVSEHTFALAEERLQQNKVFSSRRTKTPSVSQGLVACGKCGYALYRTSARTSARKISYYRCLGSDAWRYLNGPLCNSRPVRQDLLDDIVWTELVRLLEDPALVKAEIDRRLEAARVSDPNQQQRLLVKEVPCLSGCRPRGRPSASADQGPQGHRPPGHGLSGRVDYHRRVARQNARAPPAGTGAASRTAIRRRSCPGSGDLSPARRDPDRLSGAVALVRRNPGHRRTAAYRPAPREGGSCHRGQNHHPPLHPDLGLARRRSGAVETRQRRPRRRKLPFAFGASSRPWPATSTCGA